jgi:hypothetical protein
MMKMTKEMHVDAEPEEVLSILLDSSVNPPGMTMAPVHEAPGREGSVYEWSFKIVGLPQKGIMIITEYVPGKRLSTRNLGAMESTSTITFEPEDRGTRATMNVESRLTFPLIGRFLDSFLKRGMLKNIEWTMRQVEMRHAKKEATAT